MRIVLTFVAAFALPLSAVAQPAPNGDKSTEVSELAVRARKATEVSELVVRARKATEVSDLTVNGMCSLPADSEGYRTRSRLDRRQINAEFDASSNSDERTEESPGTREFILRSIADFRNGTADYAHMTGAIAQLTATALSQEQRWIVCRGAFKDIKFLHVSQRGYDDFEIDFSGGAIEWEVKPLNSHQVTDHWAARFYYPEPETAQFYELLKSMERGVPSYFDLTPDFASTLKARWPRLQQAFKNWGGSQSIYFLRQEGDGWYTYKVVYKDHPVVWHVAPLDGAGKIAGLKYDEAPS